MGMQLTPEQEQRIQAVVKAGAYSSAEQAIEAAVAAVEAAAALAFEGSEGELEGLLLEGLASKELSEDDFWSSIDDQTNAILSTHKPGSAA